MRSRIIPNWLTVPTVLLAWGARWYLGGWPMLRGGLIGFGVGFGIYLLFFLLKGRGGGDVKLMGAYGALMGSGNWFILFILTALLGGIVALIVVLFKGRLWQTIRNIQGLGGKDRVTLESEGSMSLPHGAVAAIPALLLAFALQPRILG